MSYQPGIPTGTVGLNQDYLNIQGNFTALNSAFLQDHSPLTGILPPVGTAGYHTAIHLVPQAAPAAVAGYGQLYSNTVNDGINTDQILFWITGTGNKNVQFTRNFAPKANTNGYTFLPGPAGTGVNQGALIYQWGKVTGKSGAWPTSEQTLTFNTSNINFVNNCFGVWTTFIGPTSSSSGDITINSVSTLNFKWQFSGSSGASFDGFYWFAIGN